MKYMLIRKADADTEQGVMPSNDMLQTMAEYNERMANAGVFLDGQGLHPSRDGCSIEFHNGKPMVTDGPFAETKELIAGFSVLEVKSKEEAIEWAKQWPTLDADGNVRLELRRFYELEDFEEGPGLQQHRELGERQQRMPDAIDTYLFFDGNCREALNFYADVLGGTVEDMLTYEEAPADSEVPDARQDSIMHGCVNLGGRRLMGTDSCPDDLQRPVGANVVLSYADPEQGERVFNQLAEGGVVGMAYQQTFWAYRFGMVTDRFGIPWMINCEEEG